MADKSHIEWTDATWNIVTGCSVVSPGCTNCYAMKLAGIRLKHHPSREGLTQMTKAGPVWNGKVRFNWPWLYQTLKWKKPRMIFVCAHGDLFHEDVPDEWIDRVFAVMALSPQHTYQVLTKRADRMRRYMLEKWQGTTAIKIADLDIPAGGETGRRSQVEAACEPIMEELGLNDTDNDKLWTDGGACKAMQWQWPLPNVWLGVSVEDQQRADERIPHLLETPAAIRFASVEPFLGPIDFQRLNWPNNWDSCKCKEFRPHLNAFDGNVFCQGCCEVAEPLTIGTLDWIIAGGESGQGARPMHPQWVRETRDQCQSSDTAFFFKQWGNWTPGANVDRTTGTVDTALWFANSWMFSKENLARTDGHIDDEPDLYRVGKKAAGRLLDGVEHNEMPEVAA